MSGILDAYLNWAQKIWYALGRIFGASKNDIIWYQIKPFIDSDRDQTYWFGILSWFLGTKSNFKIIVEGNKDSKKIYVWVPAKLDNFFKWSFYSNYPQAELVHLPKFKSASNYKYVAFKGDVKSEDDFKKSGEYLSPIKTLFSLFDFVKDGKLRIFYEYDFNVRQPSSLKSSKDSSADKNEQQVKDWLVNLLIGFDSTQANIIHDIQRFFETFVKSGTTRFVSTRVKNLFKLSQALNFFHLPTSSFVIKNLAYIRYRRLPYPSVLPTLENSEKNDITILWYTDYRDDKIKFWIKKEDKMRHMYIVGKTWMGKSTLISNMARSDMITGSGVGVIDPHGDLIETLIQHTPSWRINDVVLFDVGDFERPIGFNILEYRNEEEKNLVVSWVVATFKKLYGHSWGPRLEYILRQVLLTLLDYPQATLLHLTRILTDKNFRKEAVGYLKDELTKKFWRDEFERWSDSQRNEAVSPIINKVGQFLSSPVVRNIFWQNHSKFSLRQLMDEGKIVLINLSKGKIGEDNAAMIGSFLVTKLQIEVMSRADIPEDQRKKFFLYIDEFQNFATEAFENIFSEARKYKLGLIVANQYVAQVEENIRNSIFGNVGSIISFQLGYDDATLMSSQLKEKVSHNDLMSLPRWNAYTKLMIDGITSEPFSMTTFPLPPIESKEEKIQKVKQQSRQRWATPRDRVEKTIDYWAKKSFSPTEKAVELAQKEAQKLTTAKSSDKKSTDKSSATKAKSSSEEVKTKESQADESLSTKELQKHIGKRFDGIVKLKFNYWVFVIIPWIGEWLLHKTEMDVPEGVRWKDLFNVPDKIKVKIKEIKEVEGEIKLVLSQK